MSRIPPRATDSQTIVEVSISENIVTGDIAVDIGLRINGRVVGVLLSPEEARELASSIYEKASEAEAYAQDRLLDNDEVLRQLVTEEVAEQCGVCAHGEPLTSPCEECKVEVEARKVLH